MIKTCLPNHLVTYLADFLLPQFLQYSAIEDEGRECIRMHAAWCLSMTGSVHRLLLPEGPVYNWKMGIHYCFFDLRGGEGHCRHLWVFRQDVVDCLHFLSLNRWHHHWVLLNPNWYVLDRWTGWEWGLAWVKGGGSSKEISDISMKSKSKILAILGGKTSAGL